MRPDEFEIKGPVTVDGDVHLSREDLLQVELLQTKAQLAASQLALTKYALAETQRRHAVELREVNSSLARTAELAAIAKENVKRLWFAMSKVYGVDFAHATYDDVTGHVKVIDNLET